jgi:hypothetical protein
LDTHTLWIQQAVRCGRVDLRKVKGEVNPADLLTKHLLSRERMGELVELVGCKYRGGRSEAAPQTRTTTLGKATLADAGLNQARCEETMPHLAFSGRDLDDRYPSLRAPDDIDDGSAELMDRNDVVFQAGRKEAEEIARRAMLHGRRRCEDHHDLRDGPETEPILGKDGRAASRGPST